MPDPVPGEMVASLRLTATARRGFGEPLYYYAEIGSTNDEAARLAGRGATEGTTVVSSSQTAGRGRFGRTWFSPAHAGLYTSVVVRDPRAAPLLTLAGGVAVAEGITTATGLPVQIKWPNDVVVEGGLGRRRKVAGILAEASTSADGLQYVVLGFGINLRPAAYPADIADRATSIESELGRAADAGSVLAACLTGLGTYVDHLKHGRSRVLLDRWAELSPSARGAAVSWESSDGPRSGRTAGIAGDGALLVRTGGGTERIISGVVRWT